MSQPAHSPSPDAAAGPAPLQSATPEGGGAQTEGPRAPVGIVAPEWSLSRSARGAALWRHAGAMNASAGEGVEVLALDRDAAGARFTHRDQWNVPAADARFRLRRVVAGGRTATFSDLDRARLEGLVLDWVRERGPRLVHVLDLEPFGPGLLLALDAADVPAILTMERLDELRALHGRGGELPPEYAEGLQTARRIVVRSAEDAAVAQAAGAPRERIRVMSEGPGGEIAVLRAYASLYRLLAA